VEEPILPHPHSLFGNALLTKERKLKRIPFENGTINVVLPTEYPKAL